ncbi:MAG: hypothetical protein VZQ51_03810 [Bacteroidales bacterium]|nr:hypothetical protein [Bacteroidales bacterium]
MLSSCELEENEDGGGTTGGGGNNNNNNEGLVESFNVSLNYNSKDPSAISSLDVNTLSAVSANDGDVTLCWQSNYGYMITSPDASQLRNCYAANDKDILYTNTKTTKIQNLGSVSLSNYDEVSELKALNVTSGSIPNLTNSEYGSLSNQVLVNSGDVIAFQKGNIKGVGQVTGLSKVTKKITFKGYVYNPSAAK